MKVITLRKIMITASLFYSRQDDKCFSHVILSPVLKAFPLRPVSNKSQGSHANLPDPKSSARSLGVMLPLSKVLTKKPAGKEGLKS